MEYRLEKDSMGEVKVPADKYYGAQTQRAIEHFAIGREKIPKELIQSYGFLKKACALVNGALGKLDQERVPLIVKACDEVIEGKLGDHFPLNIWQTGSGTQTNMNVNEVIANRAMDLAHHKIMIHPNDHVNMSQSSNDTFPSAMHIASRIDLQKLLKTLDSLTGALRQKEKEFQDIIKIGRTHLQDATPITLGQEFSGYVALLERNKKRIEMSLDGLYDLAIGGTAVGTGLNAPRDFGKKVAEKLHELTNFPFRSHPNKFAALSSHDELVFASGALKTLGCALMKIANDIRWLGSGPRCGLGELTLPENEPGSSIMPGKVNPTQCEALTMVAVQVISNDVAISFGGSQGNFELNVYKPVIIFNFLRSISILKDAMEMFQKYCVEGLEANKEKIAQYVDQSLMLVTALSPVIGYDKCAKMAHLAYEKNMTLKEACLELGYLSEQEFEKYIDPTKMV